ncbi:MAG: AraC family transcriptional regulator [Spirochaetota bacterium]
MENTIRRITTDEKLILFRNFKDTYGVNSIVQFGIHRDRITKPKGRPRVPDHMHSHAVEINYQAEGRQRYYIGDTEYHFDPDTVYTIAPNVVHGSRGYVKERGLTYYLIIAMRPAAFLNYDAKTGACLRSCLSAVGTKVFPGSVRLKQHFEHLVSACESTDEHTSFRIRALVTDIILETHRASRYPSVRTPTPAIEAAAAAIRRSNESPSLTGLASASGLSYSRFLHRFKDEIGESPKAFMIRQRIEKAKRTLRTSKLSISDVAYASGFHSINLFIAQFKKLTGMTPREFRRSTEV